MEQTRWPRPVKHNFVYHKRAHGEQYVFDDVAYSVNPRMPLFMVSFQRKFLLTITSLRRVAIVRRIHIFPLVASCITENPAWDVVIPKILGHHRPDFAAG